MFYYAKLKHYIPSCFHQPHQKILKILGTVRLIVAITIFLKILMLVQKLIFHHWQWTFFTVFLYSFLRKHLPNAQVWRTMVCQTLCKVKTVFHEKKNSYLSSQLKLLPKHTSLGCPCHCTLVNRDWCMPTSHLLSQHNKTACT